MAALALLPIARVAQAAPPRIAFLSTSSESNGALVAGYYRAMIASTGLVEGKDYAIDYYWCDGRYDRFPALAKAAVARNPALIVVTTIASARAAQQATRTIPVVMTGLNDPVGMGLVASFARPGANITGLATMSNDIVGKLIELTREVLPGARRVGILINPQNASNRPIFQSFQQSARAAGMKAEAFEVGAPDQLEAVLSDIAKKRPDAIITGLDSALSDHRVRIAQFAATHAIPIVSTDGAWEVSGALVTYTAQRDLGRMAAGYIQKILAGAKPADLPVQQPTAFELAVNTKHAQALKLKVPQSLLLRADKLLD